MNRIILIIFLYVSVVGAQDVISQVVLSFNAKYEGSSYSLDSIEVINNRNGTKITKYRPDTLLNLVAKEQINLKTPSRDQFKISQNYPNPFNDQTQFDLVLPHPQRLFITISNTYGQLLLSTQLEVPAGVNHFSVKGGGDKLYFLLVKSNNHSAGITMVNTAASSGSVLRLEYLGEYENGKRNLQSENHILVNNNGGLEYTLNDTLTFIGYITRGEKCVLSETIDDSPTDSKEYVFNFIKEKRIVILMYHELVADNANDEYERSISDFANDLIYVRDNYQLLSMDDLLLLKSGDLVLNRDAVIVTFDDGYKSTYDLGFPLLKKHNVPATIFVVAEWMEKTSYLTWAEAWTMSQFINSENNHLISLGSHTSTHPFLEQAEQIANDYEEYIQFLNTELRESKDWIVDITQQPDIFLALPYGDGAYNQNIIDAAKRNGYKGIRTSVWNSFTVAEMNLFALPSIPILNDSPIEIIEYYLD